MNQDIKTILQCAVVIGLLVFGINQCAHADEADVQKNYDDAIYFISNGATERGCKLLQKALLGTEINDTYHAIYEIGIRTCNWTIDPGAVLASEQKS